MSYTALAKYYDMLMTDFDYQAYESFLSGRLIGKRGLDLACGSGEITLRLKKLGYDVTGADFSPEMLNLAVEKAKRAHLNVPFLFADLNQLSLEKEYDFITVVCDGLNYVTSKERMRKAFSEIYRCLPSGGQFIFDISSKDKLVKVLGDNLFYEDSDSLTYFWQNKLQKNRVEMELTFFEKDGDLYKRYDEFQIQYFYDDDIIFGLLTEVGFKFTTYNEGFTAYKQGDRRLVVFAVK